MSRVLILVEGQTERAVLQQCLSPHLGARGISIHPRVLGKPGRKGGVRRFEAVLPEILSLIKQEQRSFVTTFFDYYGLPLDWPGVAESKKKPIQEKARNIEAALRDAVTAKLSGDFNPDHFIPYVQMFELEALLFTDPKIMAEVLGNPALEKAFQAIVEAVGGCELIDDCAETAPSKRIAHHASYRKGSGMNAQAPIIVQRIGIDKVREKCPHFHEWVGRLETLHV